ncbi:hypothetical protein CAC42_6231 [Sphaceloma murrayae]|uniref:Enoyl reductase (ER) domain-containing protein n=1 Tax=Sphaceloma murrayae TaxID=2082308 RepID=A0A2K1QTM5_9PEZI|nr:hypothetical protein CAC42_6231 [Sphaceloma murrayae]
MPYTTQAYTVHEAGGPIELEDVTIEDVRPGEVLVETVAFSICATDLKAKAGKFLLKPAMILGHEASGIVLEAPGSKKALVPGSKIILTFSSCGTCPTCIDHAPSYCDNLSSLNFSGRRSDGSSAIHDSQGNPLNHFFFGQSSMARLILARETSLVKLPDDTPIDDLRLFATLGCGLQTGAGAILNVCNPPASSTIAILGAGAVGLSAALAALTTSPSHIILVDNDARKFQLVPPSLRPRPSGPQITHIDSSSLAPRSPSDPIDPLTTALLHATRGKGLTHALDCVGHPSLIEALVPALAARGTAVTVGGGAPGAAATVRLLDMLIKGRTWRGTHQGDSEPGEFLGRLIGLWRKGEWGFDGLVRGYGFEEVRRAVEDLEEARVVKAMVVVR